MRVVNVEDTSDVRVLQGDEVMVMMSRLDVHRLLANLTNPTLSMEIKEAKFNADLAHSLWESLK